MDQFVIGRVVTAIELVFDPVFDQLLVVTPLTTRAEVVLDGPLLRSSPHREDALLQPSPQLDVRIGSLNNVARNISDEEAFVAPIDTKVSIDTIVQ
jgi:hypothetical protein